MSDTPETPAEWQEIAGLQCEKCGHSPVEVLTPLRDGWVREDDPARCPDCGATGTVWLGCGDNPTVYYAGEDEENATVHPPANHE